MGGGEVRGKGNTSAISGADSRTVTLWPARRMDIAAPSPPRPAPTTITYIFGIILVGFQYTCGVLVIGYLVSIVSREG